MTNESRGPAYRIETKRLVLRCWNPADAPLLVTAVTESLEHLRPWMPWAKLEPQTIDEKIALLRRFRAHFDLGQDFVLAVLDRKEERVLGGTGLHVRSGPLSREIGYWIHAHHIGQGYATELAAALTGVAFEIDGVDRVEIHCAPNNERSARVPQKLGFEREAVLRRRLVEVDGEPRDTVIWTQFRDQYPGGPAAKASWTAYDAAGRKLVRAPFG
jgi:RimJ/RimL family protein N-acetyltransferase